MQPDGKDISKFYDEYSTKQAKVGINIRHRTILKNMKKEGLKNNSSVLEIGCGIGTVTQLLSAYCVKGKILAADISPESIEMAKRLHAKRKNIEFIVSDMSNFTSPTKFNFILLPDVLEHIPVDQHKNLFAKLRAVMHKNSVIVINIPSPHYLIWAKKNIPDQLQIIDQPLNSNELLNNVYANDLYLHSLNTYSLNCEEGDYQSIVLKPNNEISFHPKKWMEQAVQNTRSKLF